MARVVLLVTLSVVLAVLTSSGPALAQGTPAATPGLKVNEPTRTSSRGQLVLGATLTTAEGKPLSDREVEFYQQAEFFGARDALLGTTTSDATGVALLVYQPAVRGRQVIKARFAGGGGLVPAEATATIEVREIVEPFEAEEIPLAVVREWLPSALGLVVAIVWTVLFGVLIKAVVEIKLAARSAARARLRHVTVATPNPEPQTRGDIPNEGFVASPPITASWIDRTGEVPDAE